MINPADDTAPVAQFPVLCLDFDGVICDSCEESSITAWRHAKRLWPKLLPEEDWRPFLAPMRRLRPVVHTGYELTLLIRLLAEGEPALAEILDRWDEIRPDCMARWGLEREALIEGFGAVRDRWIASDPDGWLSHHAFYPPVADLLRTTDRPFFVITTKQARFCARLLESAGIAIAADRLFGLEAGAKTDVLAEILTRQDSATAAIHFVEDNLATLEKVATDPRLEPLSLYLANWGYNTAAMRQRAAAHPRITVISPGDLVTLR